MTAVEWFLRHVNIGGVKQGHGLSIDEVKEQALEIEKRQIINAYIEGYTMPQHSADATQYYYLTYKIDNP